MSAPDPFVFGLMRAAERDMAIPVDVIQEVVAWPERITLPLRPSDTIRGLFDLRGQVVPIVALDQLLGSERSADSRGNIAVLKTPRGPLGITIDGIGGILRVPAGQAREFVGEDSGAKTTLMRGLLRTPTGGIIPILDEAALAALPGLVFLVAEDGVSDNATQHPMRTWLVFICGAFRFCVDATCVREIIGAPEIGGTALATGLYRGSARVRGGAAAVVELHTLLRLADSGGPRTKLLVLEHDGAVAAVPVSDIVAIQRRSADDIRGIPAFGSARRDLIAGIMQGTAPEEPDVIVLSHAAVLSDPEVRNVRGLHAAVTDASTRGIARKGYLKVEAGQPLYVKLAQCAEILPMPERPFRVGPTDATYLGLLRHGAQTLPLIRLRALLDGSNEDMPASVRVLMAHGAHAAFGFVVDAVQGIEYLPVREDLGSTSTRCAGTSRIWVDTPDGPRMRTVLDLDALADQLALTGAA